MVDRFIPLPCDPTEDVYRVLKSAGVSYSSATSSIRKLKYISLGSNPPSSLKDELNDAFCAKILTAKSIPLSTFTSLQNKEHIIGLGALITAFRDYTDYRVQELIVEYVTWLRNQYDEVYAAHESSNSNEECYGSYLKYAFKEFIKACESVVVSRGVCGVRTGEMARLGRRGDVEEILQQRWSREAVGDKPVRMDEEPEEAEWGWVSYEGDGGQQEKDISGESAGQGDAAVIPPPVKPQHWPCDHSPLAGRWMVGGMEKERKETEPWSHRVAHEYLGSLEYDRVKCPGWGSAQLSVPKELTQKAEDIMEGRPFDPSDLDFAVYVYLTTLQLGLPNSSTAKDLTKPRLERVLSYLKTGECWTIVERLNADWNDVIEWRLQSIYDHYKGGMVKRYREWRTARGRVLVQAAKGVEDGDVNTARVMMTIIGREIMQAVEDGFKDLIRTLTSVADIVLDWGDGGEAWGEVRSAKSERQIFLNMLTLPPPS